MPERTELLPTTFAPRKKQKSIQENKIYERKEIDNIHKVLEYTYNPFKQYNVTSKTIKKNPNISNTELVVSSDDSNEGILESVLNGSGKQAHKYVVALNTALVLWVAGKEDNLNEGFNKVLHNINEGKAWNKFQYLKSYLSQE